MLKPYKPQKNHPWKTSYKVNLTSKLATVSNHQKHIKPLQIFLTEIIENWSTLEVDMEDSILNDSKSFSSWSDRQKAKWLSDFLKRHYVGSFYYNESDTI